MEDLVKEGAFDQVVKGKSRPALPGSSLSTLCSRRLQRRCSPRDRCQREPSHGGPLPEPQIVDPVVQITLDALRSAAATPIIKRFVLASSFLDSQAHVEGIKIDDKTWNEESKKNAREMKNVDPWKSAEVCAALKGMGEQAAWKFVKEEKVRRHRFTGRATIRSLRSSSQPDFEINTVFTAAQDSRSGYVVNPAQRRGGRSVSSKATRHPSLAFPPARAVFLFPSSHRR